MDTANVVIVLLIGILLFIFIIYLLILLLSSNFRTLTLVRGVSPVTGLPIDDSTAPEIPCLPGQCATSLFSGEKRCPSNSTDLVSINPLSEVCNERFSCTHPLTPFALQSDGSTNLQGNCEEGSTCNCLRNPQCADYILSIFSASNGNPYTTSSNSDLPFFGQRLSFPQLTPQQVPPFSYDNPGMNFCTAPLMWLPLSSPGCNFSDVLSYEELVFCMGGVSGCSGSFNSPCRQGILAFITGNPQDLTQADINNTPLGCVRGTPCPCGRVAIYDTNSGSIVCRELN
jgi:hypothetical protein